MGRACKNTLFENASRYLSYCLAFFLVGACSCDNHSRERVAPVWTDSLVTALLIPEQLIGKETHGGELQLRVKGAASPVLGTQAEDKYGVTFTPAVPLTPGTTYQVLVGGRILQEYTVAVLDARIPEIVAIFPSADTLPENLLKFYLHFSKEMQQGKALEYIRIRDRGGRALPNVFLDLKPELWDTSGTVLTIWLDPGRIKRGLELNQKLGNPLATGSKYTFEVLPGWKDRYGVPAKPFSFTFHAGKRDEHIPAISSWKVRLPGSGSMAPMFIVPGEALDHFLLEESILLKGPGNQPVNGKIQVSENPSTWRFDPAVPWVKGEYSIVVNARLEDLAGNNLNRLFDRDVVKEKAADNQSYSRTVNIP